MKFRSFCWLAGLLATTSMARSATPVSTPMPIPVATHWIGTWAGAKAIEVRFVKGQVIVNYRLDDTDINQTKADQAQKFDPLPDVTIVMCQLP